MLNDKQEILPAYYATKDEWDKKIPIIMSVLFINNNNEIVFLPILERTINRTIDSTQKNGIVIFKITNKNINNIEVVMKNFLQVEDGILLFLCETFELTDLLYKKISNDFSLSLIKDRW